MRRSGLCLLICSCLAAQEGPAGSQGLVISSSLGVDPFSRVQLVYPGCWDGLMLGARAPRQAPPRQNQAGATVEVWDLAYQEGPRQEGFHLYLERLRQRLSKALDAPPARHGAIELADIMANDPANPQKLDLTKVKSMQERFNLLPPDGSPARPRLAPGQTL